MRTPLDQAQDFSGGVVAAARQRDRWARREANSTDGETREQYREAIADLEARYPDLEDVPVGGSEAFAHDRGHGSGSRSPTHEGRRRPGAPKRSATPAATKKKSSQRAPATKSKPKSRRSGPPPTPRIDRAISQTGIPAAVGSGTSTMMALIGGTIGVALLYLVLSSAETRGSGGRAVPALIGGVVGAIHRFLSLEDIFGSSFAPHVVPGAKPVRTPPTRSEVERVLRESGRYPGERGRGGEGATLSNPAAELQPPGAPGGPPRKSRRRSHR